MSKVSDKILKRVYLLVGFILLSAAAIVFQIVRLQYFEGDHWRELQEEQRVYPKRVLAERGAILADDGSLMAVTLPFYRFAMDVTVLNERDYENLNDSIMSLCDHLANEFGQEDEDAAHFYHMIRKAQHEKDRHIYLFPVKRRFTYRDYKTIRSFPVLNRGPYEGGFIAEKVENKRFYPLGRLARITLGQLEDDTTALRGIEYAFNKYLRGRDGKMMVQRVSSNVEVPLHYYQQKEAQDGHQIISTLNIDMQDIVDNALRKSVDAHEAKHATAILMETKTGEIKALANYPEVFNFGVASQWEPGSTFKIASAIAALETGIISPTDSIAAGKNGRFKFYDRVMHDERDWKKLTLGQAIAKSSNIAIARMIDAFYKRQPQEFIAALEKMGLLESSGIQLKGEPKPYVIRPKHQMWNGTTLPWMAIGYNVRLTPLQILSFYNGIANNGKLISPVLVKEIRRGADSYRKFSTEVRREQMAKPSTIVLARHYLEQVVKNGTAGRIHSDKVTMAGKTGTTRKLIDGEYKEKYRASFVGYFPADNPQYSCIVVVDEPQGEAYYGSEVAAPVFKEVAEKVTAYNLKQHPRELPRVAEGNRPPMPRITHRDDAAAFYGMYGLDTPTNTWSEYVRPTAKGDDVAYAPHKIVRGKTPDVRGMSARNAVTLLENHGFRVRMKGYGRVKAQSIPPNMRFRKGSIITLELSTEIASN